MTFFQLADKRQSPSASFAAPTRQAPEKTAKARPTATRTSAVQLNEGDFERY